MDADVRADFVERFARLIEQSGQSRNAGRIYAYLATSQEPYLSLQELAEQLAMSRGSVSLNTRSLIAMKMLTRVAVPGSRGDHYALVPDGSRVALEHAAQRARDIVSMAEEGLRLQPRVVTTATQSLRSMRDTYGELARAIEALVARPARQAR